MPYCSGPIFGGKAIQGQQRLLHLFFFFGLVSSHTLENGILELPDFLGVDGCLHRGEVVGVNAAHQPTTTRQTRDVRCALQQATQATIVSATRRSVVPGRHGAGTVEHGAITTARDGQTDVGQGRGVLFSARQVLFAIEAGNGDALEQGADRGDGLLATAGKPFLLLRAQFGTGADLGSRAGAVDLGGRVALGRLVGGALLDVAELVGEGGIAAEVDVWTLMSRLAGDDDCNGDGDGDGPLF